MPDLLLQFDESTFSPELEKESKAGDGEGVYWDQNQNEMKSIWTQLGAGGG